MLIYVFKIMLFMEILKNSFQPPYTSLSNSMYEMSYAKYKNFNRTLESSVIEICSFYFGYFCTNKQTGSQFVNQFLVTPTKSLHKILRAIIINYNFYGIWFTKAFNFDYLSYPKEIIIQIFHSF